MNLLDQLNPQQREAVETTDGPLLILAGAGSGKTRVITYRIAYLIDYCGVPPGNILAVTFTNKAAEEMRNRVDALVHTSLLGRPWLSTFHSFCVRLLREDGSKIGLRRDFSIYDEDDQLSVVKACVRRLSLSERELPSRGVLSRISHAKNHSQSPEDFYQTATDPMGEKVALAYQMYNKVLRESNAVDFDDLLLEAVRLLSEDAETALKYNQRYRYLLVDEYQDTNRSQYQLIRLLTQTQQNVCVVGDEDQSIYSWRGADIRNILEFEKDYPQARIIRLEENYRSTQTILDAAAAVVSHNLYRKGKKLWTSRRGDEKVYFYEGMDGENESLFVADWIVKRRKQHPDEKIAILYRTNSQSRLYEESLRRYGLKYSLVGGFSFYERTEVKDLLAYLKAAANPQDSVNLLRIVNSPPRGIGEGTVKKLEELARAHNLSFWDALEQLLEDRLAAKLDDKLLSARAASALENFYSLMKELQALVADAKVPELLNAILERTEYSARLEEEASPESLARLENIEELLNAATDSMERGEGLTEFLDHAALVSDVDAYDEKTSITLMTLHSAKGLEFPVVFLAGLEEGLLPHNRSLLNEHSLEEERRLCYVGMTRAQDLLILTRARSRRHYGDRMPVLSRPSRFWSEIPEELLQDISPRIGRPATAAPAAIPGERFYEYEPSESPSDHNAMPLGARVRHPRFGYGTVLQREGVGDDVKLTVSFPGVGLKKLIEKYAGLERL